MNEDNQIIQNRKEKLLNWIKNPVNFSILSIVILGIIIRIYLFVLTKNQPLWWDEADYMAYAKNLAGYSTGWTVTGEHSSVLIYLFAFLFKLGLTETYMKFLIEIIPSILLVFLTYKIADLMYNNKKIALVSGFLMAIFWNILFYSMRFMVDVPALLFAFLAIYAFFQGYERNEKVFGYFNSKWAIPLTGVLIALSYSIRRGYFIFGLFFLVYALFTRKIKDLVKDKYNWIGIVVSIIIVFLFEKLIFAQSIISTSQSYYNPQLAITGVDLKIFGIFFSNVFNPSLSWLLYLFYFGVVLMTLNIFLSFGYIKQNKDNFSLKGDIFCFLSLVIAMSYFIFYQRTPNVGDPRWYFPVLLASFICIARASVSILDFFKKYKKDNLSDYSKYLYFFIGLVFVLILLYGGYSQFKHADQIIRDRVNSFNGLKQAGLYLGANSNPEDVIIGIARPQLAYYANRKTVHLQDLLGVDNPEAKLEDFLNLFKNSSHNNLKFFVVDLQEPRNYFPDWMRKVSYSQDPSTGQTIISKWEIPFMDSIIDFQTGQQKLEQSKTYGDITFKLLTIQEGSFIYEIQRK